MRQLTNDVLDEFQQEISARQINVRKSDDQSELPARFDAYWIRQVVRSIVSNAVEFSTPGNTIALSFSTTTAPGYETMPRETAVSLSVCDEGPGISEDELEHIFANFTQGTTTKTGAGGSGLGLSLCREIVAAHGGEIWAENNTGRGTTFTFSIPSDPVASA